MHKTLVLGVLLVFALSGQAPSGNHPLISMSETETISATVTPQVTPVPPKKAIPKIPDVRIPVQKNPSMVAVTNMLNEAKEMHHQVDLYYREVAKLRQNPTVMQNIPIKSRVEAIMNNAASREIEDLLIKTQDLEKAMLQVLNASTTK
jgi:L-arabinose isomerase